LGYGSYFERRASTIFAQKHLQPKETTMLAWGRLRGKRNGVTAKAKTKHKVKIPGA
jgi:hypothetical protein